MTNDNTDEIGGNSEADLKHRVDRLMSVLDDIAEATAEKKLIIALAKDDGYDPKILNKIVAEMRKGADYQAACLEAELVLDTYRKAVGLPRNLEDAQALVRERAVDDAPKIKQKTRAAER